MNRLTDEIINFFNKQSFTVVSTVDPDGSLHNSCKGIVKINKNGQVYLLDLYKRQTYANIRRNPQIAVTAVNEHSFKGFSLKGKARVIKKAQLSPLLMRSWEKRLNKRITRRVLKNIAGEKGHSLHPELRFPGPEYVITVKINQIVDLTPDHLKEGGEKQ
ncbi:MAG: pyridoxamine 5'-phosphate oxidase family protein [Candidatus Omnitrophica bacterium]|nr:pyridoxamine 5'-phosphate oxidase family protein [Candidatus Omnitrophota bacterium]